MSSSSLSLEVIQNEIAETKRKLAAAEAKLDAAEKHEPRNETLIEKYLDSVNETKKQLTELIQRLPKPIELNFNPRENLRARFGLVPTTAQMNTLLHSFPEHYNLLFSPCMDKTSAKRIIAMATSVIGSQTKTEIVSEFGYLIDGPIRVSAGQIKSHFYYAVKQSEGNIFVAKVYNHSDYEAFNREVRNSELTRNTENVVSFKDSFSFGQYEVRHFIIMPFYPRSAADLLLSNSMSDSLVDVIAHSILKAIQALHQKGLCFCDIKPANIMLGSGSPLLVDLASIVPIGSKIIEMTKPYFLDCDKDTGSMTVDYYCLGSTISQLMRINIMITSRQGLIEMHEMTSEKESSRIALHCLKFEE